MDTSTMSEWQGERTLKIIPRLVYGTGLRKFWYYCSFYEVPRSHSAVKAKCILAADTNPVKRLAVASAPNPTPLLRTPIETSILVL